MPESLREGGSPRTSPPTVHPLPSVRARAVAFAAIVVAGLCGLLIGRALVLLQCEGSCATSAGLGGLAGAVAGAGGVAVVAVLVLRAMSDWQASQTTGQVGQSKGPAGPAGPEEPAGG